MRQYLIISWIHLILSVINLALAAPLVIREGPEVRVDMVDVAKDWTAASQTRHESRSWDPRDEYYEWSGSSRRDALPGQESESSGESDPEARPNSPSTETESEESGSRSEGGSNDYNSAPSSPSSAGSPHAYPPPVWGGGMASHDAIADGDQQLLLPPSPPNGWDHAPMPQSSSDGPPSRTQVPSDTSTSSSSDLAAEGLLQLHPSYPSGPESIGWEPTSSKSTGSGSTSSGSISSGSTSSDSASSGSTGSDGGTGTGSFIRKLLKGKIEVRTSGSRTVNAAQTDTLD